MRQATGCDGVMIGRGAVANPWLFAGRERDQISPGDVQDLILEHLGRSLAFYGEPEGLVLFRKFAASYLEPYELDPQTRRGLLTELDPGKFKKKLGKIFGELL